MFEVIFDNIIFLLPIALFIAFRVIKSRGKEEENPSQKEEPRGLKDLFELFGENHDNPSSGNLPQREIYPSELPKRTSGKSKSVTAKDKPVRIEIKPADNAYTEEAVSALNIRPLKTQVSAEEVLFEKIKYLSPMQKAIVLAEILGPAKALDN